MDDVIYNFKNKFNTIRRMGYVKAINNSNSGIGLTFEYLLGKKMDNYPLPDFENALEIKTKLSYSTKPIHLFKLTPDGNGFIESKRIVDRYGYYGRNRLGFKVFNGTVYANKKGRIGANYLFSLHIDYKNEKVFLEVYNKNGKLIECSTFWTFDKIENAMQRKLKYLALVLAWSTRRNGNKYYKYYKYTIYKYTNIYTFLDLLSKGIIGIAFSVNVYTNEVKYGQIHDHGTSFDIKKEDLEKLFIKIC